MAFSRGSLAVVGIVVVGALFGGLAVDFSGDGLRTYENILHHSSPLDSDTDGDGLTDGEEVQDHGTDPTDEDTDNDRLSDYEEIHKYGSDPTKKSTTRPLPDGKEVHEYGLDPSTDDTDGDGAPDHTEVMEFDSDPHDEDTDDDGLTDGEEADHDTDPTAADSDDDGLTDYEEVNEYVTDPTAADSGRGTGMEDDVAVRVLRDPLNDPYINDTEELEPYFEADNNIYAEPPLTPSVESPYEGADSSGDGFSDAYSETQNALTVDEQDIFVQVSYQNGSTVPISALLRMQEAFENAPVTNTAGEEVGINLHIYIDSEPVDDSDEYKAIDYYGSSDAYRSHLRTRGYYHVYIVNQVRGSLGPEPVGVARDDDIYGMLIEGGDSARGTTIMHELGHELGLWPRKAYTGIDTYSAESDYPSVMNYRVDEFTYSDGPGHDDWGYISANLDENSPPNYGLKELREEERY